MKTKYLKYIITISFSLFIINIRCYTQMSKEEMSFLIKLSIFQESTTSNTVMNIDLLKEFCKLDFKIDTLKAINFDDFIFLSISPNFTNPGKVQLENFPLFSGNCQEYIVAFYRDIDRVYKLKGFKINDFPSFIFMLKSLHYPKLGSYSKFIKHYSIDKVNLGCLYKAFTRYNMDKKKYPCLSDCIELSTVN